TVHGLVANGVDVDYYTFAGKKGQRVVVSCLTTSIDSRMAAGLEVYDAAGRELARHRPHHVGDSLLDCAVPAGGEALVRRFEYTHLLANAEHFYRLTISTAPLLDAVF